MPVALEVFSALALVAIVLAFMWRMPQRGTAYYEWAPRLARFSARTGLAALAGSGVLWVLPRADPWLVVIFLLLDPAALAAGTLVLWIYRNNNAPVETVVMQRTQAWVG